MKPVEHLLAASAVGGIAWGISGSPAALGAAVVAGVAPDIDHLLDYGHYWLTMSAPRRVWLLLHGWEFTLIFLAVAYFTGWHPIALGALFGYLSHVAGDQFANNPYRWTYLFFYRARHGFHVEKVSPWGDNDPLEIVAKSLPFGRPIVNWMNAHLPFKGRFGESRSHVAEKQDEPH